MFYDVRFYGSSLSISALRLQIFSPAAQTAAPESDTAINEITVTVQPNDDEISPIVTPESEAAAYEQKFKNPVTDEERLSRANLNGIKVNSIEFIPSIVPLVIEIKSTANIAGTMPRTPASEMNTRGINEIALIPNSRAQVPSSLRI